MPEPTDTQLAALDAAVKSAPASAEAHFALAKAWHVRGDAGRAAEGYRRTRELSPAHVGACCNFVLALRSLGRVREAEDAGRYAVEACPGAPEAHNNLGLVLQDLGRLEEAATCYTRALALRPQYAEAHANLGALAGNRERFEEAEAHFRKAIALQPNSAMLHYSLACALYGSNRIPESIAAFEAALALNAAHWESHSFLGIALMRRGELARALGHCEEAMRLAPRAALAHQRLGVILRECGRSDEAVAALERAIALDPAIGESHTQLATTHERAGRLEQALEAWRRSIEVAPAFPVGHCGRGITLAETGRIDEALDSVRRAIELKPDYEAAHSAYLFFLNYSWRHSPEQVFEEHRRWARPREAELGAGAAPFSNSRDPGRRLRIGYISPDFRQHSVAFFIAPVLARHDRRAVEVFLYSDVRAEDAVTRQIRGYADCWRSTAGLDDARIAAMVREDGIDLLVDLAAHSGSNRLLVFARRAAPVQVTWLGYAGTTGLSAMDYKLTDPHLDPPGSSEAWHSERLWRLPDCYFCYTPPPDSPPVRPREARADRAPVFCAFQNLAKVGDPTLDAWCGALRAVPAARLAMKARGLGDEGVRASLRERFTARGIDPARVTMEDWSGMNDYLARLSECDAALDTSPFNGGTTTLHALWMGVPVVTLEGRGALARMGASILRNIGAPELIARTATEFGEVAARLARDPSSVVPVCGPALRERLIRSPLMDAGRFVAHLEDAYRRMWEAWCARAPD